MYTTKNTLPEKTRIQVSGMLQDHLANSIDLLTEVSRDVDKDLWFVESPIQASR